jgi:hypothetical protein
MKFRLIGAVVISLMLAAQAMAMQHRHHHYGYIHRDSHSLAFDRKNTFN